MKTVQSQIWKASLRKLGRFSILTLFGISFIQCKDNIIEIIDPNPCDQQLQVDDADASDGAKAIDICQQASVSGDTWGLLSAEYTRANGDPADYSEQIGIQGGFGPAVMPRKGGKMLALSTGSARTPGQPGYCGTSCFGYGSGTAPLNFPHLLGTCTAGNDIFDDIALEINLRTPLGATGFSVDFAFFTLDNAFPCTIYNDQFVLLMDPAPSGSLNGNLVFDGFVNPVSVNMGFITTNSPMLAGNGYEDGATTGWLQATAPVEEGTVITLKFIIWDSEDAATNSTVLIDNFQWLSETTVVSTSDL